MLGTLFIITASTTACSSDGGTTIAPPPAPAATGAVGMGVSSFQPNHVAVFTAGVVTWTNNSGVQHNITFTTAGAPANIGNHDDGATPRTFPNAGVYDYHCTNHGGMNGRVTVVAAP